MGELLNELEGLSPAALDRLRAMIPEILKETPESEPAARRFKEAIVRYGGVRGEMLSSM